MKAATAAVHTHACALCSTCQSRCVRQWLPKPLAGCLPPVRLALSVPLPGGGGGKSNNNGRRGGGGNSNGGRSAGGNGRKGGSGNGRGGGDGSSRDLADGALNDDRDPGWDRFDPAVKTWCDSKNFGSVHAARMAWQAESSNKGLCFWTCSELGKVMGGECRRGNLCSFKASHT